MENDILETSNSLSINADCQQYINQTAKWARFLAIVGAIFIALYLIMMIFMGGSMMSVMSAGAGPMSFMGGGAMIGIGIAMMLLYLVPIYFMFKFANAFKAGVAGQNMDSMTEGMRYFKSFWKFIGILMAIGIALYIIMFIAGMFMM